MEYAHPSYKSLSHDCDSRFLVRWQARDLFMPSQLDEQVATSHVVLTVLPKEDADFTDVKAHGPFQEWHCRFGTRFILSACWQDWPRVIHLSRCRVSSRTRYGNTHVAAVLVEAELLRSTGVQCSVVGNNEIIFLGISRLRVPVGPHDNRS